MIVFRNFIHLETLPIGQFMPYRHDDHQFVSPVDAGLQKACGNML